MSYKTATRVTATSIKAPAPCPGPNRVRCIAPLQPPPRPLHVEWWPLHMTAAVCGQALGGGLAGCGSRSLDGGPRVHAGVVQRRDGQGCAVGWGQGGAHEQRCEGCWSRLAIKYPARVVLGRFEVRGMAEIHMQGLCMCADTHTQRMRASINLRPGRQKCMLANSQLTHPRRQRRGPGHPAAREVGGHGAWVGRGNRSR